MKVTTRDGLEVTVTVRGAGPEVLLVHGFGGSAAAWGDAVFEGLSGRRVLAVDLPGHGESQDPVGPQRVSIERVLDDLECVLDAAAVSACPWIGYSMGGRIALAAAVLRPLRVERLVLESATPGIEEEEARAERRSDDEALAMRITREGVDAWVDAWERRPLFAGRSAVAGADFLPLRRANRAHALAAWLRGMGAGVQPSFWSELAGVQTPTCLITGERDAKFARVARRAAEALPHAEHVSVAGAGHTVHLDAPGSWAKAVDAFLRG